MSAPLFSLDTRNPTLVTFHNFMRATATARAWHTFRHARRALEKRVFEGLELFPEALAPARGDGRQAPRTFERLPNIHSVIYDRRASRAIRIHTRTGSSLQAFFRKPRLSSQSWTA